MITIKLANTKKELKAFVTFPFSLYKNSKYWVPPIISQELATFDKDTNPIFNDAEATFFLAYKNGKIVGRIVAIVNWLEIKNQSHSDSAQNMWWVRSGVSSYSKTHQVDIQEFVYWVSDNLNQIKLACSV